MQLNDSVIYVSGGASGLGAACVRRFATRGARVIIADLNQTAGAALASAFPKQVHFISTDVTDEASVRQSIDATWKYFGGLDGVVNCAGIATAEKTVGRSGEPHTLEGFLKTIQINLAGTFNCTRLAASAMVQRRPDKTGERGVIVNTASVAAFDGQIGQVAYAASKGAIAAMTLPLARDLAAHGIRVVTIAPGIFDTPMMAAMPEKVRQSLAEQVPFPKRLGNPEEFAALAQHIFENEMLNGEVIRLDGAIRMGPK